MKLTITTDDQWEKSGERGICSVIEVLDMRGIIYNQNEAGAWAWKVRRNRTEPHDFVKFSETAKTEEEARLACERVIVDELVWSVKRIEREH
nr:hypothetical protein [Rhodococcus sp. (in: high G+C Gram-positive bacteria)]